MADVPISELPVADALTGSELSEVVQGGVSKKTQEVAGAVPRVKALEDLNPGARLTALESIDAGTRLDSLENEASDFATIDAALKESGVAAYIGAGPDYPLLTDKDGWILLGYDSVLGVMAGRGLVNTENAPLVIGGELQSLGQAQFTGEAGVAPVLTDRDGRVLLGYDIDNARIIGAGLEAGGAVAPVEVPLDDADKPVPAALNHLLFYGQSLSVGAATLTVLSTTQPYSNVTFAGGPRAWDGSAQLFAPLKPLVEDAVNPAPDGSANRGETCCSGAANYATTMAAIEDGLTPADHVILSSTAGHGGWKLSQLQKGTAWYTDFLLEHAQQAKTINSDYACHAVGWVQGENDGGASTPYATYLSGLLQLQVDIDTDIRAISGQLAPVHLLTYQTATNSAGWREVQRAQLAAAQQSPRIHLVTPIYHLPHGSDGVHLTSAGYKWMGAYFGRAYKRLVHDGVRPQWLNPVSATRRDAEVRVRFDVPCAPLTLDILHLAETTDYGFRVTDGGVTATISNIAIDGNEVVITLSDVPAGAVEVRYAMDYLGAGLNISTGASGNLRDSAPEVITISGVSRPLFNVAPHFTMPVVTLGE